MSADHTHALLVGLGVLPGAEGVRAFAAHYDARSFAGRGPEVEALDRWLQGDQNQLLVVAPAGLGKSALVFRWAQALVQRGQLPVWLPVSSRFGTASSAAVRALLSARLKALGATSTGDWTDAAASHDAIVIVDGLDEASDRGIEDDLRALATTGARVVVTARSLVDRDAASWRMHLGWPDALLVEPGPLSRAEVTELFADPAEAAEAMRATGGDPLELELRRGNNSSSPLPPEDVDASPVLDSLACAVGPISSELLSRVAGLPVADVEQILRRVARAVVINPEGGISFAHPRLAYQRVDALNDDTRAHIDLRFAVMIREEVGRLMSGAEPNASTPYVLTGCGPHLARVDASVEERDRLVDPRWLEVWEVVYGGTSGFLASLVEIWQEVDRQQQEQWSDERATLQFRYAVIAQLLGGVESSLDPGARAQSVRLGLRSQRAAIASLTTITDLWRHREAVRALVRVLDERGFDLLLATVQLRSDPRWPATEMMQRLIALGLEQEALLWLDAREPLDVITSAVACFPHLSDSARGVAATAIRNALQGLDPQADVMEALVTGAGVLSDVERNRWLAEGQALVADDDESLYWDSRNDERDPRLVLAEALATAGDRTATRALLERVHQCPYPFGESSGAPGPEVVQSIAVCAQTLDDASLRTLAHSMGTDGFARTLRLVEAGLDPEQRLEPWIAGLGQADAALIRRAASSVPSRALASRTLALVRQCTVEPTLYANGYALHNGLLWALGRLASLLTPSQCREALELVCDRIEGHDVPTVRWWHIGHALVPLLASADDATVAAAVMARALGRIEQTPPLCAFPRWEQVWNEAEQREYLRALLRARPVAQAPRWCELVTAFASKSSGEVASQAAATAVDLALEAKAWRLAAQAAGLAGHAQWKRVAARLTEANTAKVSVAWPLSDLLGAAPSAEASAEIARIAWATPRQTAAMGCATELLAALPQDEAESVATTVLDGPGWRGGYRGLPPRARARAVKERRAQLEAQDWRGLAQWIVDLGDVHEVDVSDDRRVLVEHLRRALPDAPDASALADAPHSPWTELAIVLGRLEVDELNEFEEHICDRGPKNLIHVYFSRLTQLGQTARARRVLGRVFDAESGGVLGLRYLLTFATSLAELEPFFEHHADYVSYGWVLQGIRDRDWHEEYAVRARQWSPTHRLLIWDALWDALSEPLRRSLRPALHQTLAQDLNEGHGARHAWWERLDISERRTLWLREYGAGRARCAHPNLGVSVRPSAALGLIDRHAQALTTVMRWFVRG